MHVKIQWNDEFRGVHTRPQAGIHFVLPYHPSQKQVQPLARAPLSRAGKKITMGDAAAAKQLDPRGERRQDRLVGGEIALKETGLQRSEPIDSGFHPRQKHSDVASRGPTVPETTKCLMKILGRRLLQKRAGPIPHSRQSIGSAVHDLADAAVRQQRGQESCDFPVAPLGIPVKQFERVRRDELAAVVARVNFFELPFARPHTLRSVPA